MVLRKSERSNVVCSSILPVRKPFPCIRLASCLCVTDRSDLPARSGQVLFVADRFHPVDGLAVETFLNGDVRHGRGWCGAMPMFLTRREPDNVPRTNVLDRTPPALDPAAARRHD